MSGHAFVHRETINLKSAQFCLQFIVSLFIANSILLTCENLCVNIIQKIEISPGCVLPSRVLQILGVFLSSSDGYSGKSQAHVLGETLHQHFEGETS